MIKKEMFHNISRKTSVPSLSVHIADFFVTSIKKILLRCLLQWTRLCDLRTNPLDNRMPTDFLEKALVKAILQIISIEFGECPSRALLCLGKSLKCKQWYLMTYC